MNVKKDVFIFLFLAGGGVQLLSFLFRTQSEDESPFEIVPLR